MKKVFATILAVIYLSTSMGATIHLHYCMGKLASLTLWHSEKGGCNTCEAKKTPACMGEKSKDCCKDEHKWIKLDKDHKAADATFQSMQLMAVASLPVWIELPQIYTTSLVEEHPLSHAPPRGRQVQLHLLNCNFRI